MLRFSGLFCGHLVESGVSLLYFIAVVLLGATSGSCRSLCVAFLGYIAVFLSCQLGCPVLFGPVAAVIVVVTAVTVTVTLVLTPALVLFFLVLA